jgi:hypothetical protein
MSRGLLKSKNKKNKLLKQYKQGRIAKEVYVAYNKIYRKLVSKEQEKAFSEKMNSCSTNSKKKWRVLKSELKLSTERENIETININGKLITSKDEIAKGFRDHFETCAQKLVEGVTESGECEILLEQQPEWGFKRISETELLRIIKSLETKNSCGFDLLSNAMLK